MKYKARKVTKENGEVELRLCLTLSAEEAANAPRIADDPNVTVDIHRLGIGEKPDVQADFQITYLRNLVFWASIWNERERNKGFITYSMQAKEARKRKPRKKRVRKPRRR